MTDMLSLTGQGSVWVADSYRHIVPNGTGPHPVRDDMSVENTVHPLPHPVRDGMRTRNMFSAGQPHVFCWATDSINVNQASFVAFK